MRLIMKLRTYLRREKLSPAAFADRAGCSMQTIYNVMSGKHLVRSDTGKKIIRASGGRITWRDLLDESSEQDEREPAAA